MERYVFFPQKDAQREVELRKFRVDFILRHVMTFLGDLSPKPPNANRAVMRSHDFSYFLLPFVNAQRNDEYLDSSLSRMALGML